MKKILYVVLFIAILLPATAQESGIRFFHGSWDEAIALAKKEKKKIFIDFFTEWCGPCLNMALTVFPLPQVGEVYNKNFICLKIDAEKGEGRELAKRYHVASYPTYVFVNPKNQELIHRSGGNKPVADFLADVNGAFDAKLSSVYLTEKYKSGQYDADFLKNYIRNRKVSGDRNVVKDFDRLIEMGCKLTDKEIWDLYCECVNGYDNPYVQQISDNYTQFVEAFGKKAVDEKLTEATTYAPIPFTQSLCDFNGKDYNVKMAQLTALFREQNYAEAWKAVDRLIADSSIDQHKFIKLLSFYVRVSPKYTDDDLSFETIVNKVRYMRYVAYNMYERDEAMTHYNYAVALEYLIQRAQQEGKAIPSDLFNAPKYGKQEYDMRHPLLKAKPGRQTKK
ncbi:MAG: thioredoxin family protein [Odoribacter sp.]